MSQVDLEQGPHRLSFSGSADGESSVCFSDADDGSCYSQFFSTNGGSYDEYNFAFVSGPQIGVVSDSRRASSVLDSLVELVEIEIGVPKIKVHLDKVERDSRICHLGLESNSHKSGASIELVCSCKDDDEVSQSEHETRPRWWSGFLKLFNGDRTTTHFLEFILLMGSLLIALLLHGFADYNSNHNGVD